MQCSLGLNVERWWLDLETDHWYQRNIWLVLSTTCRVDALKGYSHKPDCFKKAANKILGRCEELDMDEDTRVNGFRVPFFFLITNHSRCHHDVSCDLHDLVRGCNRNTLFHSIRVYGLFQGGWRRTSRERPNGHRSKDEREMCWVCSLPLSSFLGDKKYANVAPWQAVPSSGQVILAISGKYVGCLRNSYAYIHRFKPHTAQLCYAFRRWNNIGKLRHF